MVVPINSVNTITATIGNIGSPVRSVNGYTGEVVLDYEDVGALSEDTELFSGNYNDLTNKPTIPTKTSDLTNDSGFLTEHQSLSGYATQTWVQGQGYLTSHQSLKTINDTSIVGVGNINLHENEICVVSYNSKTALELFTLKGEYAMVVLNYNNKRYPMVYSDTSMAVFSTAANSQVETITVLDSTWSSTIIRQILPEIPATGNYTLKCQNGITIWVEE